jgi:xylan 1,4-beta-xylosidase
MKKALVGLCLCVLLQGSHLAQASAVTKTLPWDNPPDITIHTDQVKGTCYRFWTTMAMINQDNFKNSSYIKSLEAVKPFTTSFNLVRMLGGRKDGKNNWYKGVNDNGKIITDFTDLVPSIRAVMRAGFKPRLVLDNVPSAMSTFEKMDTYGNTKPPDDYELWRQYIRAFLRTLIDAFGYEEVETWRFRVGTEPDLYPGHWSSTKEAFLKHYDITVDEVLKVIPTAKIGPGNITDPQFNKDRWGLDIIDHCATGTNYATGKIGTPMHFFSFSYYERLRERTIRLDKVILAVKERLSKYPQFRDIPIDIQEFGIYRDERGNVLRGLHDISEFGASWYAAISDITYKHQLSEIYEWGATSSGLPHPRQHVLRMLEKMAGGKRLEVTTRKAIADDFSGAIACTKGDTVYVLLYNHHPNRKYQEVKTLRTELTGSYLAGSEKWSMNEWSIDHDHGVWAHALYKDCDAAGLQRKPRSPLYDRIISNNYNNGWKKVYQANLDKYLELARFPQTARNVPVSKQKDAIRLAFDMPGNSVKLIELKPD